MKNLEQQLDWNQTCLEYRIRCFKHVLNLAPLPEFKNACYALENYRDLVTTKESLKRVYKDLNSRKKYKLSYYGYSAVGEIYLGLLWVLYATIHPTQNITNGDCYRFVEAAYIAANFITPKNIWSWVYAVQKEANDFQNKEFETLFDNHHKRWGVEIVRH